MYICRTGYGNIIHHNDGTQARVFDGDQFTRNSTFNQNHCSNDFLHHCLDLFCRAEFIVVYVLFLTNFSAEDSLDLRVETSFMQNFEHSRFWTAGTDGSNAGTGDSQLTN
jgi:hypothetical protein